MTSFYDAFDSDYRYFYDRIFTDSQSDAEAALIWRLGSMQHGTRVLDAGCGYGRMTNRLAALGADMTGIDQSKAFIEMAQSDAASQKLSIEYVNGDTRELPWNDSFDFVLSWSDSLGYFDDNTTEAIIGQFHKALNKGGKLILQVMSRDRVVTAPRYWAAERDDNLLMDETQFMPADSKVIFHRTIVRDGKVRKFDISLRVWTPLEIGALLQRAGFQCDVFFGTTGEAPTTKDIFIGAVASKR